MAKRKFYIETTTGMKIEIDERDFNNLDARVNRGQTNGWYMQRGLTMGDISDWKIQVKDIACFYSDKPEVKEDHTPAHIDIAKHKPAKVGAKDKKEPVVEKCNHDWNNPDMYEYITVNVQGVNRYYKHCPNCEAKSTLVKKREVELAMEAAGKTIEDVREIKPKE